MLAFSFARCTARPSHAWAHTGLGASLERSPAATPLCCSGFGRAAELAARCALRSNSRSESEHEARSRAPTLTLALLGVPEAPPGRCAPRRDFAEVVLARRRRHTRTRFAAGGPGGGDLCGAEHRSGVFAQRKPPQCEPPPGTACREAARETQRQQLCN